VECASGRVQSMLRISTSIRIGLRGGGRGGGGGLVRIFLLESLVDAFGSLVDAFCCLHAYLKPHGWKVEMQEEREVVVSATPPSTSAAAAAAATIIIEPALDATKKPDAAAASLDGVARQPSRMGFTEDADDDDDDDDDDGPVTTPDNTPVSGVEVISCRKSNEDRRIIKTKRFKRNSGLGSFRDAEKSLSQAKADILQTLLASRDWKELADYATVSASSLATSALEFLARGDTGTLRAEEIYQEYCSSLVRMHTCPVLTLLYLYPNSH